MSLDANAAFTSWLEEDNEEEGFNVIVADFIEEKELISAIIDKNLRLALKLSRTQWSRSQ